MEGLRGGVCSDQCWASRLACLSAVRREARRPILSCIICLASSARAASRAAFSSRSRMREDWLLPQEPEVVPDEKGHMIEPRPDDGCADEEAREAA